MSDVCVRVWVQVRTHAIRTAHENIDRTLRAADVILAQFDRIREVSPFLFFFFFDFSFYFSVLYLYDSVSCLMCFWLIREKLFSQLGNSIIKVLLFDAVNVFYILDL